MKFVVLRPSALFLVMQIVFAISENDYIWDPRCETPCTVNLENSQTKEVIPVNCQPIRNTQECVKRYSKSDVANTAKIHCASDLLHFETEAYVYRGNGGTHYEHYPVSQLNMSAIVLKTVSALKMELECIKWEQNEDLCIRDTTVTKRGNVSLEYHKHWPCRLFDFDSLLAENEKYANFTVKFPSAFHYACLRARPFTHFRVNVSLYPQNCESSYFMVIPDAECLEPHAGPHDWHPLVIVDTGEPSGVQVRLTPPSLKLNVGQVELVLQREKRPGEHLIVGRKILNFSSVGEQSAAKNGSRPTGYFFANLLQAKYFLKLHFLDRDRSKTQPHCQRDIVAYFWLVEDKFLKVEQPERPFQDWSVTVALTVLTVICTGVFLTVLIVFCRKYRQRLLEAPELISQFSHHPKILILYTDDTLVHRNCVSKLASFLQVKGHCKILFDEWELTTGRHQSPDRWLFSALEKAEFYLIVFSEGSNLAFQGQEFIPRRHWTDLFNPGVTFVLQELLNDCRKRSPLTSEPLNPYLLVQFSYSDQGCIEPFLNRLPISKFILPSDLRELLCHVHKAPFESVAFSDALDANELEEAVVEAERYYANNSNWLSERLQASTSQNNCISQESTNGIAKLASDLENFHFGNQTAAVTLNVNQAYARFCNNRSDEHGSEDGSLLQENSVNHIATSQEGGFELFPPESEPVQPLVPKYNVLGSPDSDSE